MSILYLITFVIGTLRKYEYNPSEIVENALIEQKILDEIDRIFLNYEIERINGEYLKTYGKAENKTIQIEKILIDDVLDMYKQILLFNMSFDHFYFARVLSQDLKEYHEKQVTKYTEFLNKLSNKNYINAFRDEIFPTYPSSPCFSTRPQFVKFIEKTYINLGIIKNTEIGNLTVQQREKKLKIIKTYHEKFYDFFSKISEILKKPEPS